jgi:hypothetical protein
VAFAYSSPQFYNAMTLKPLYDDARDRPAILQARLHPALAWRLRQQVGAFLKSPRYFIEQIIGGLCEAWHSQSEHGKASGAIRYPLNPTRSNHQDVEVRLSLLEWRTPKKLRRCAL